MRLSTNNVVTSVHSQAINQMTLSSVYTLSKTQLSALANGTLPWISQSKSSTRCFYRKQQAELIYKC